MKELVKIQGELNAPKNQRNNFGKYNYRSAEDILEALKPLLVKYGCFINISDTVELIGNRYYIKAVAKITNIEGISVESSAYAREEESKKGMDSSQLTGSTSSYARKYALNGLFAIDDNKDADTNNYREQINNAPKAPQFKPTDADNKKLEAVKTEKEFVELSKAYSKFTKDKAFRDWVAVKWEQVKGK